MTADKRAIFALALCLISCPAYAGPGSGPTPLPTNVTNYYIRGTQPNTMVDYIAHPDECGSCHGGAPNVGTDWDGSLMAQAARDPLFWAALDIAEHDAPGIGDTCIRCHAPQGWIEGRATPTDGSGLDYNDREGVSCSICHRSVDPFNSPGAPVVDPTILLGLGSDAPLQSIDLNGMLGNIGNGGFVIDPFNRIRGPFPVGNLPPGQNPPPQTSCNFFHVAFLGNEAYESPLHRRSEICASCHDVSTPHFIYNSVSDKFDFSGTGVVDPNSNKYHMMPQQRTYSEWLQSSFAAGSVPMNGRFGGNGQGVIQDCMDCHMPKSDGFMCDFVTTNRSDIGRHFFSGAATWVLEAIAEEFGPFPGQEELTFDDQASIAAGVARNRKMLKCAADLDVVVEHPPKPELPRIRVRVVNQTGHKLPTGFPEGRRMWLNVEFYNTCTNGNEPVVVRGGYDLVTSSLDESSTKVYEAKLGPSPDLAPTIGVGAAPSFHVAVSNQVYKDNRIPPRGFTNTAYEGINAEPVAASYADGQFWDDTYYPIPAGATGFRVRLYYETASREYVEFLRDKNPNAGTPGNRGEFLYDLWNNDGAPPAPVLMASYPPTIAEDDGLPPCSLPSVDILLLDPDGDGIFALSIPGDINGDLTINDADVIAFANLILSGSSDPGMLCMADFNGDGELDGEDLQGFVDLLVMP
ncbi:MAG: dockerin type I repeat-containing protein [Planctomycetes bacterium]|nr:dockerin type I repeat-containing protein [Planctomycetota bacterium]